jgi:hypothetical protein
MLSNARGTAVESTSIGWKAPEAPQYTAAAARYE